MRQADVQQGLRYALLTKAEGWGEPPTAAEVVVAGIPRGGRVAVKVIEPGPRPSAKAYSARPALRRGAVVEVATRDLTSLWEEWPARLAATTAHLREMAAGREESHKKFERTLADQKRVGPAPPLPATYDPEWHRGRRLEPDERRDLAEQYRAAARLGPYARDFDLASLLEDLPPELRRDTVAALARMKDDDMQPPAGSVGEVLAPAAYQLERARAAMGRRNETLAADAIIDATWVDFLQAARQQITDDGGDLILPPTLPAPAWHLERLRDDDGGILAHWGWIRVAAGNTGGSKLHNAGCQHIHDADLADADQMTWWSVALSKREDVCGTCGGPGVAHPVELAHLTAAVDIWNARGRGRIEHWQFAALGRVLAAAVRGRYAAGEADVPLAVNITAALAKGAPGEEGWDAYYVTTAPRFLNARPEMERLSPERRAAAESLAVGRLNQLAEALPVSRRPSWPTGGADIGTLSDRYRSLKEAAEEAGVHQVDRQLFTLPGAR